MFAPPAGAASPTRSEVRIVQLINHERIARGLAPVHISRRLVDAARYHSAEMLRYDYFAHDSRHPAIAWDRRIRSFLSRPVVGEALAWGTGLYATPAMTVHMWITSPPHRKILLDPAFRWVGIGRKVGHFAGSGGAVLVTADFAGRR